MKRRAVALAVSMAGILAMTCGSALAVGPTGNAQPAVLGSSPAIVSSASPSGASGLTPAPGASGPGEGNSGARILLVLLVAMVVIGVAGPGTAVYFRRKRDMEAGPPPTA